MKIKAQLNSLFSIIHNRIKKIKREVFPYIFSKTSNRYIDYEKSKLNLKKAIIIHKIKSSGLNLFSIYKYYRLRKKAKFFQKWKNTIYKSDKRIPIFCRKNDIFLQKYKIIYIK